MITYLLRCDGWTILLRLYHYRLRRRWNLDSIMNPIVRRNIEEVEVNEAERPTSST